MNTWRHLLAMILVYLATFSGMFVNRYQASIQAHQDLVFSIRSPWFMLLAIGAFVMVLRDETNRKGLSQEAFRNGKMKNLERRLSYAFLLGYGGTGLSGLIG